MEKKIIDKIEESFKGKEDRRILEFKDRITQSSKEKYRDLIDEGKTKEEAYEKVIEDLGDLNQAISRVETGNVDDFEFQKEMEKTRRKFAIYISLGLFLILLAIITPMSINMVGLNYNIGGISFVLFMGLAIIVFSYAGITMGDKIESYKKNSKDRNIESYLFSLNKNKIKNIREERLKETIESIIWLLAVVIFLIIGISTGAWGRAWIVFILAIVINKIFELIFYMNVDSK